MANPDRRDPRRPDGAARGRTLPLLLLLALVLPALFGLIGREAVVVRILIGHASAEQVRSAAARAVQASAGGAALTESDWNPKLRRKLQDFARGIPTDFSDVKLEHGRTTPFRKRVIEATRTEYANTFMDKLRTFFEL